MSLEYFECAKTQMLKIHVLVVAEPPSQDAAADASAQAPSPDADAADAASAQAPSPADAAGAEDAASAEPPADDASDAQIYRDTTIGTRRLYKLSLEILYVLFVYQNHNTPELLSKLHQNG